jgi:cellobiose phosphorylase
MNLVGIEGKGESVWLSFFQYDVLVRFSDVAIKYGDAAMAVRCDKNAKAIKKNVNTNAWDGKWFLRAFFDVGRPLGSSRNEECKIDAISQSWAILSGAGDPKRNKQAMESVNELLISRSKGIVQLLDPPFDKSDLDPGYIKGYVPGVRENGGQYTHAAIWMGMAFAKMSVVKNAEDVLNLINPVLHARTPADVLKYKVEPYVMPADVYGMQPHTGRGGWTWYTGSAGWMYQFILESLMGLSREGNTLRFAPQIPDTWDDFSVSYRFERSLYKICVRRGTEAVITLDGFAQSDHSIHMIDDGMVHNVSVLFVPRDRRENYGGNFPEEIPSVEKTP